MSTPAISARVLPTGTPPSTSAAAKGKKRDKEPKYEPRKAASDVDKDALLTFFLWEISQALKLNYCPGLEVEFNRRQKIVFSIDYSQHIPLRELREAAFKEFAPPVQRLLAQLEVIFHPLPDDIVRRIIYLAFGREYGRVVDSSANPPHLSPGDSLRAMFGQYCFGDPTSEGKAGRTRLTMTMPKNADKAPPRSVCSGISVWDTDRHQHGRARVCYEVNELFRSLCKFVRTSSNGFRDVREAWWGDSGIVRHSELARRIERAEAAVSGRKEELARALNLPAPVVDTSEPHSLLVQIELNRTNGGHFGRSISKLATMVIPNGASL